MSDAAREPLPTEPDPRLVGYGPGGLSKHPDTPMIFNRAAYWLLLHIPSGAGWRFSRFRLVRRLGDWWLPRWYGLGVRMEDRYGF